MVSRGVYPPKNYSDGIKLKLLNAICWQLSIAGLWESFFKNIVL